eukprot:6138833-Prymnesium_polylepis.1
MHAPGKYPRNVPISVFLALESQKPTYLPATSCMSPPPQASPTYGHLPTYLGSDTPLFRPRVAHLACVIAARYQLLTTPELKEVAAGEAQLDLVDH